MGQTACIGEGTCVSSQIDQCDENNAQLVGGVHWSTEEGRREDKRWQWSREAEEVCQRTPSLGSVPPFVKQDLHEPTEDLSPQESMTGQRPVPLSACMPTSTDHCTRDKAKEKSDLSGLSMWTLGAKSMHGDDENSSPAGSASTHVPSLKGWTAGDSDMDDFGQLHLHFDLVPSRLSGVKLVDLPDEQLVVVSVHPEATLARTAFGDPGLVANDIILEVDGFPGSPLELRQRLEEAFTTGAWLSLLVQPRPMSFDVEVKRQGRSWSKLGVLVRIERSDPEKIWVQGLRAKGLLPAWNATNGPTLQILSGDCITHVNGVSKSAEEMYRDMEAAEMGSLLRLRICTPHRGSAMARSTSLRRIANKL